MSERFFIAGTDTDIGKTYIACELLKRFQQAGKTAIGLKPLASGSESTADGLRNGDALALQAESSIALPYDVVNPIAYSEPIAPHIAASKKGDVLSVERLWQACQPGLAIDVDITLIEGVGGWLVPLNHQETMADFAKHAGFEVILVVGMQLGCLNHALLTVNAIQDTGLALKGWVANFKQQTMAASDDNLSYLKANISSPLLWCQP